MFICTFLVKNTQTKKPRKTLCASFIVKGRKKLRFMCVYVGGGLIKFFNLDRALF